ncbi:hypothetical protein Tco_0371097 [Tanacetum coccineum]
MGTIFSSPDNPNPNTTAATTTSAAVATATTTDAMSQTPSENPTNPDQEYTSQPPNTLETPETQKPNQESQKNLFLPFSFSSLRELEADAVTLLKRIRKFFITQDIGARAAIHIFNRISFAIAKGVRAQIVSRLLFNSL